jgi:uncharacterized protein (DUF486 family)
MTFAWYGHLKHRESPLWMAIVVSWLIAFVEYCFQVPANRIASYQFSTALTENHPGSHHSGSFLHIFSHLPERQFQMELCCSLRIVGAVFFMFKE